jgi:hypothetical protein
VSDDGSEIIVLWCPPEHLAGTIGSRNDLRWIAGAARCDLDLEVDTRDALDHLNHLTHRETMAIAAIKGHRGATRAQIAQRVRMRADEVADVDVIANAGTVRRRIISPIDFELRSKREGCLDGDLDQVGCVLG